MRASEDEQSIEEAAREAKEERDRRVRDATVDALTGLAVTQFLEVLEQEQVRVVIRCSCVHLCYSVCVVVVTANDCVTTCILVLVCLCCCARISVFVC
jgi:hypothetical protein